MRQKFFTNTLQSNLIKNILYNTPLPIFETVVDGSYLLLNHNYIYKNHIIKCTRSGYLNSTELIGAQIATIEIIDDDYNLGDLKYKYVKFFHSSYNYYDSATHEYLGDLLRCYRDIYNIDLMPFYNCFSGRYQSGITISEDVGISTIRNTSHIKTFKIPIKLNKKYTIALDSDTSVYVAPVFMEDENNFLISYLGGTSFDLTSSLLKTELGAANFNYIKKYNSTQFKHPFIYELNLIADSNYEKYKEYENNLYLLIQLDALNTSSLVVLEGDYLSTNCVKVFNVEEIQNISDTELNKLMLSELSLLQLSDGTRYPFADRLIEYFLLNVITERDPISSNIARVQEYVGFAEYTNMVSGVWSTLLRKFLYDYSLISKTTRKLDLNGFVDKEVEKLVLKGKEK